VAVRVGDGVTVGLSVAVRVGDGVTVGLSEAVRVAVSVAVVAGVTVRDFEAVSAGVSVAGGATHPAAKKMTVNAKMASLLIVFFGPSTFYRDSLLENALPLRFRLGDQQGN
jgi:hypothetical protein